MQSFSQPFRRRVPFKHSTKERGHSRFICKFCVTGRLLPCGADAPPPKKRLRTGHYGILYRAAAPLGGWGISMRRPFQSPLLPNFNHLHPPPALTARHVMRAAGVGPDSWDWWLICVGGRRSVSKLPCHHRRFLIVDCSVRSFALVSLSVRLRRRPQTCLDLIVLNAAPSQPPLLLRGASSTHISLCALTGAPP